MKKPKPLRDVVANKGHQAGSLQAILRNAHRLEQLDSILKRYLQTPLYNYIQLANYREGILILLAPSPVWASRLRHMLPQLRQNLLRQSRFKDLRDIQVRIAPLQRNTDACRSANHSLSPESAAILEQSADTIQDPALKSALQRLAHSRDKT
ncbi:MAG: hypothetical protein BMS9Abin26_1949 [Gammaproteobacteria bacterium]|nr:MAG: hypothetical protein BMS9Abin26_1949 [Gammaproteobacteria bacterium]